MSFSEIKYLTLIGLLLLAVNAWSQAYKPLLDTENEWHFTTCFDGCITDLYFTDGDTLVDGVPHRILDGYHYISRTFLLREDVPARKVYLNILLPSGPRQFLLYDFDMAVGDSIDIKNPVTPFPEDGGYYRLDSIVPRVLEDGNARRHFYLSPSSSNTISSTPAVWIEGVGSLSIITAPGGYPDINAVGHLSCAFKESGIVYSNLDSIDSCMPEILSSSLPLNPLDFVELIQEPSKNTYRLINTRNVHNVDLYDLHGQRLKEIHCNGEDSIFLELEGLNSGIYLLVVQEKSLYKRTFKVLLR